MIIYLVTPTYLPFCKLKATFYITKKNINHQNSSTSSPHPSTASTWPNTFNSDQTSSTSSPHPLTASPINKTSNHQSSSTSRPNPSTYQLHHQLLLSYIFQPIQQ